MAKHNKKRNPALIYEVLTKEAAIAAQDGNKVLCRKIMNIVKEGFKKGTEIRKEFDIFSALLNDDDIPERVADKLLQESKKLHAMLDVKRLEEEKDRMIDLINKSIGRHVWSNFVPNYKNIATIAQIFSSATPLRQRILLEQRLCERMSKKEAKEEAKLLPLSNLEMKMFIKRFNEVYGKSEELLPEQKNLLSKYIMSVDDKADFSLFLYEEIGRLKGTLKEASKDDPGRQDKFSEVIALLEGSIPSNPNEELIAAIFHCQRLAKKVEK